MLKSVFAALCAFFIYMHPTTAGAATIDAEGYSQFLSVSTSGSFGYWLVMNKFYTNDGTSSSPIDVDEVLYQAPELNGTEIKQVFTMGTTESTFGPVNSAIVQLFDRRGELLLEASIIPNGTMTYDDDLGYRGEIGVEGLYTVTGGSLASGALLGQIIFVNFAFDYNTLVVPTDIHAKFGTFDFYWKTPSSEVPEPASAALLISGLVGLRRLRRPERFRTSL